MASVAICPHCYLQLSVPDRAEGDARLRCPTCEKEFDVEQAVLRTIPDAVVVQLKTTTPDAAHAEAPHDDLMDSKEQADQGIAAWFGSSETVADIPPVEKIEKPMNSLTGDDIEPIEESREPVVEPLDQKPARPAAVTLADLQRAREPMVEEQEDQAELELDLDPEDHLGPNFDLPNVPLTRQTHATVEIGAESPLDFSEADDFELDDVDFEQSNDSWSQNEPADESEDDYERAIANAATLADVTQSGGQFDAVSEADPSANHRAEKSAPGDMPSFIKTAPIEGGRRRSLLRTLVGPAVGGIIGLALGYYLLMVVLGPTGDFLQVAHYLPQSMLPGSFQKTPRPIVVADESAAPISQPVAVADTANDSPNIPATFVTPVEPTENAASPADDRYGKATTNEPARLTDPLAEPLTTESPAASEITPLGASTVRVENAPTYTTEQLSAAIDAGRAAAPALVAGDLSDASVRRTKGMSYAKLCDLAEALTFYDTSSATGAGKELQHAADDLFSQTLANPHTREEVARIATIWIDSPHRRHGGVFLAGNLSGGEIAGALYEYRLTSSDGSPLVVLLPEPLAAQLESAGQTVVVVGSIVEQPAEKIPGYTGSASRALWASRVLPLQ